MYTLAQQKSVIPAKAGIQGTFPRALAEWLVRNDV